MGRHLLRVMLGWLVVGSTGLAPAPATAAPAEVGPLVTVAGGGSEPVAEGARALDVTLGPPSGLATDGDGNLYIGESGGRVHRVDTDGIITTVAGNGGQETSGDGGPAIDASLESVGAIALGSRGELYIADPVAHRVRMVAADGIISTVAGTGEEGVGGDGGPAVDARLRSPSDIAVGPDGDLYIVDTLAHRVRMVAADGIISTVAGTGEEGVGGDGGPAVDARLRSPDDIAVGPDGELYTVDSPGRRAGSTVVVDGARVRKIGADGEISTVAGGGGCAEGGEQDGVAQTSFCDGVPDIAVAADGAVHVPDPRTDAVWMVSPEGTMIRLPVYLSAVFSLTVSAADDLYVGRGVDQGATHAVQRVPLSVPAAPVPSADAGAPWNGLPAGTLAPVAGTGQPGFAGDGGPAMAARLSGPGSLAAGPDGTIYVVDTLNRRVRSIGVDGTIETVAGDGGVGDQPPKQHAGPAPGDGGPAVDASLHIPVGVAVGPDGSVYICDEPDQRVYRVSPTGVITTFAGTGVEAFAGDGGLAIDAALARPVDVAVGPDGSVYIADHGNHRVRKVDPDGIITTVAGTGNVDVDGLDGGFSGDGGPAIDAELSEPRAVAVGPDGTVYVVANLRIRKIDPLGTITSLTMHQDDLTDEPDDLGDGVPAQDLAISPADLSAAADGTLYVAAGARVLAIGTDSRATVVAGTGEVGDRAGDGETAEDVHLPVVNAIALDPVGNLYLSHTDANQVQVVVGAREQPYEFPWHWLVLAVVAATALVAVALSVRRPRGGAVWPGR